MPTRRTDAAAASTPGTSLALPQDVRDDLLRAQMAQITTAQRLPQIKIMPAAAGLYEFTDSGDTTRDFEGVILGSHARNVLWEVPFGTERPRNPDGTQPEGPACSSPDGKIGVPRPGFRHAALGGDVATGGERIECASCPYNQFGSKHLVGGSGKGKAVTNQRSIYTMTGDRATPMELVIANTSIPAFDEYLLSLLNRGIPVQAVVTRFRQEIKTKQGSNIRWAVATFENVRPLDQTEFDHVLAKRGEFMQYINPAAAPVATTDDVSTTDAEGEVAANEDNEEIPF